MLPASSSTTTTHQPVCIAMLCYAVWHWQRAGSPVVGPSGLNPSAPEQRKALVPVPERTWALRNVANSMVRSGGAAQLPGAVKMLQEAADLAADHYGPGHPGGCRRLEGSGAAVAVWEAIEAHGRAMC
jgi:hypothetical protein